MFQVYSKTITLLVMIGLGYGMRRTGQLQLADTQILSKLVIHITLPCVVIKNLSEIQLSKEFFVAILLGGAANLLLLLLAFLIVRKKETQDKLAALFSLTTFNISNYAVPILSAFTDAPTIAGVFAFNLPTSIFTYAVVPTCAGIITAERQQNVGKTVFTKLLHSTPTLTCIAMFLLSALHISLPTTAIQIAASIAEANTFLSMLAVGSLIEFSHSWNNSQSVFRLIAIRFSAVVIMAILLFHLTPIDGALRCALTMALFSPAASCCPMLALSCGYRGNQIAMVNSIYLIISVGVLSLLTVLFYQ